MSTGIPPFTCKYDMFSVVISIVLTTYLNSMVLVEDYTLPPG
ncbi:unnamed protein product [marine sediment metagenome]|uniref:Uncharacterized protein n=1 Tax=marine sediment metagenome TaxID=412755 RepID=X1R3I1_9ZZZZ